MTKERVVLNDKEIEARKLKYWGPERNKERRDRYKNDAEHRAKVQQQVRESYRKTREENGLPVRQQDCRENIPLLVDTGEDRTVLLSSGEPITMSTFTVHELGVALERNKQVLYRWFSADLFPRPVVCADTPRNANQPVYTYDEAVALLTAFGEHQEVSQYYRKYHTKTTEALFAAVAGVRADLRKEGVTMKEDS